LEQRFDCFGCQFKLATAESRNKDEGEAIESMMSDWGSKMMTDAHLSSQTRVEREAGQLHRP